MNSLSWFLYLADVLGNVQGLLIFLAIASGIGAVFFGSLLRLALMTTPLWSSQRQRNLYLGFSW